jgi:hypothetical protein
LALFNRLPLALISSLLYAVHPVHTEAVSSVVGRAEIMAALGTLCCCLGYEKAREAIAAYQVKHAYLWMFFSILSYFAGALSKESGVVAPALLILSELIRPNQRFLFKLNRHVVIFFIGIIAVAGCYLAMRANVVKDKNINVNFAGVDDYHRILTALRVSLGYINLHLWPHPLSADYWVTDIPIARSLFEPTVILAVLLLFVSRGIWVWASKRLSSLAWGIGVFAITLFPISNIPFAIGVLKAERLLYIPSIGLIAAFSTALLMGMQSSKTKPLCQLMLGIALLTFPILNLET